MKHLGHIHRHFRLAQLVVVQWMAFLAVVVIGFTGCVDLSRPWNKPVVDMGPASAGGNAPGEAGSSGAGGDTSTGLGGAVGLGGVTGSGIGGDTQLAGTGAGGSQGSGGLLDASLDVPNADTGGATATSGGNSGAGGRASGGNRNGGAGGRGNGGAVVAAGGSVAGGATVDTGGTAAGGTGAIADASPPAQDGGTLAGLVLRYTCDQTSGPKLTDSSGRQNDGNLVDAPPTGSSTAGYSFGTGKVGSGSLILTSASNGYVSMPAGILNGATEMTIATWVYVTTVQSFQRIFDIGINAHLKSNPSDGSSVVYMNLVPSGNNSDRKLTFAISKTGFSGEQRVTAATTMPTTTWTHVAIVLGGGTGTLYINGTAASTRAITLKPADLGAVDYAWIGKSQFADPYLNGQIDDFRVYDRALSSSDVQALYVSP